MQTELEAILAKLISIPSITSDSVACHEILNFVRSEIETYGLFIHGDATGTHPWFFATTKDTKQPDILLAAHLDVVPAASELFTMRKQDGKLYGRGVYDMKLAAACYLVFLKQHADKLADLNIGFLFTTDEETGGHSLPTILDTGLRPQVVFIPDGGDNWALEKRAKGLYNVELSAKGRTAHGSRPWEGVNALHALLDALAILRSRFPSSSDPAASTLSINTISSGQAVNQLPDHAAATIDFRSFSKEDLGSYRQLLDELVGTFSLEMNVSYTGDPLLFNEQAPGVDAFLRALQAHTGQSEIRYCESYGATDGRYFAHYDIPCIIIEPRGGGRHSPDEWLEADDLSDYYRLIERWILAKS